MELSLRQGITAGGVRRLRKNLPDAETAGQQTVSVISGEALPIA